MTLIFALGLALVGAVLLSVGIRAQQGRLPLAGAGGFRTPATMQSEEVWVYVHRKVGWVMTAVGSAFFLLALAGGVADARGWETAPYYWAVAASMAVLLAVTVGAKIWANRLALGYQLPESDADSPDQNGSDPEPDDPTLPRG